MAKLRINDKSVLSVEVAETTQARAVGLSGRTQPAGDGMVFVYQYDHDAAFTVSDMQFDIDIYFFDASGAPITMRTAVAGDLSPIFCPRPYRYVLETKAGRLQWEPGYANIKFDDLHQ